MGDRAGRKAGVGRKRLIGLGFFAILALTSIGCILGMNHSGFCWAQKRWLTSEEKIRAVLAYSNKSNIYNYKWSNEISAKRYQVIHYPSVEAILQAYPDCCSIEPGFQGMGASDSKLWGTLLDEHIVFAYGVRYRDENASEKIKIIEGTAFYDNCAEYMEVFSPLTYR